MSWMKAGARRHGHRRRARLSALVLLVLTVAVCQPSPPSGTGKPGHVFVINLENKGYDKVWGEGSEAPYLSTTLRAQGALLTQYYGTDHNSATDYIAQISGQASNAMTRSDCPTYAPITSTQTAEFGHLQGTGCVYRSPFRPLRGSSRLPGKPGRATWRT
jgi:hypothetical protein